MKKQQSFSQKMFRCAANNAELTFTKHLKHAPISRSAHTEADDDILDALNEAFLRGALQTITDQAQWLELSQAVQNLYE